VRREVARARGALQSVRFRCSTLGVTTSGCPLGVGCSSRVPAPLQYRPYWLGGPTLPLAISPAVWFSRNGIGRSPFSFQSNPLFELRLPLEYYPAKPSRSAAADWLLSWASGPYSTRRIAGPLIAGLPTRYVPPSGFAYPLDGLLPAIPCRFCFAPAALMGFTLRSVLLSKGIRAVMTRMAPHTVSPIGAPAAVAVGRPNRPRFLGFNPFESPWRPDGGLIRRPLDAPLGFYPSRVHSRTPCPRLPSGSSHALIGPGDESPCPPAPQSINRLSPAPIHMPHRSTFTG
jgi:hypothetical protein